MLERIIAGWRRRRLVRAWTRYRRIVLTAINEGGISPASDSEYLELQGQIVADLEFVSERQRGVPALEARRAIEEIRALLQRNRTLQVNEGSRSFAREEFDRAWHRHFLFLGRLSGARLGGGEVQPIGPGGDAVPTGLRRRRPRERFDPRRWLRLAVQLGIFALGGYFILSALGIGFADGQLRVDRPLSAGRVLENLVAAVNGVWVGAFGPLTATMGTLVTLVLLGCCVLLVGYWLFWRS